MNEELKLIVEVFNGATTAAIYGYAAYLLSGLLKGVMAVGGVCWVVKTISSAVSNDVHRGDLINLEKSLSLARERLEHANGRRDELVEICIEYKKNKPEIPVRKKKRA